MLLGFYFGAMYTKTSKETPQPSPDEEGGANNYSPSKIQNHDKPIRIFSAN